MSVHSVVERDLEPLSLTLWKWRWWLTAVLMMGLGLGLGVFFLSDPTYEAQTKLMPTEIQGQSFSASAPLAALAGIAGVDMGATSGMTYEALEVMRSSTFLREFVSANGLVSVIFADQWNPETKDWQSGWFSDAPTVADAAEFLENEALRIREDRKTGIITVAIRWKDADVAAKWVNSLVERLNAEMRARAVREASASLDYLHAQIDKTQSVEVKQALYGLVETEIKKAMVAEVREHYALKIVDRAIPPSPSDKIWPKPAIAIAGGAALGFIMCMVILLGMRLRQFIQTLDLVGRG